MKSILIKTGILATLIAVFLSFDTPVKLVPPQILNSTTDNCSIENEELSQKLVENALKTVELYSLEQVANQYITIFKAEIESANS